MENIIEPNVKKEEKEMRRVVVLALCLVVLLLVAPVSAQEAVAEFDARRVVVSNEGAFFEGDLVKDGGSQVIYLGAVGLGFGYRVYQQADQYYFARAGIGKRGGSFGLYLGKEFEYEGHVIDGRLGFAVDGGKARFSVGAGVRF